MYWLAEQGLAPKRAFLAGVPLLIFIIIQIVRTKRKVKMPMNKNALDVLNASLNLVYTLSGNIAGGALLTNTLYCFFRNWRSKR